MKVKKIFLSFISAALVLFLPLAGFSETKILGCSDPCNLKKGPSTLETIVAGGVLFGSTVYMTEAGFIANRQGHEVLPTGQWLIDGGRGRAYGVWSAIDAGVLWGFTKIKKPWVRWLAIGVYSGMQFGAGLHDNRQRK